MLSADKMVKLSFNSVQNHEFVYVIFILTMYICVKHRRRFLFLYDLSSF